MTEIRFRTLDSRTSSAVTIGRTYVRYNDGRETSGTPVIIHPFRGEYRVCVDENHGRPPYNEGGPFFLSILNEGEPLIVCSGDLAVRGVVGGQQRYNGGFYLSNLPTLASLGSVPTGPDDHRNVRVNPDNSESLGAKAYAKLRPKTSKADLAQALLESRELPRMLKTTAKGYSDIAKHFGPSYGRTDPRYGQMSRDVASHFLNVEFGWKPFVRDMTSMVDLVNNYQVEVSKAKRANNRWVTRRFTEEDVVDEIGVVNEVRRKSVSSHLPIFAPNTAPTWISARLNIRRQWVTEVWYEGKFKVYRPEFDDGAEMHPQVRSARQFLSLAGLKVDPVVLYKVTPWSWLADWFTNTGSLIQRVQDEFTGTVVSKYMYLMRRVIDRYVYSGSQEHQNGITLSGTSYRGIECKTRFPAESNFDFSLPSGGLSAKQYAILAAIGITR